MKKTNRITALTALFAVAAAHEPTGARAAVAPTHEAVQLSPFVVDSSRDTGYQATSTLAGTRLDTPLKDLGASISIYTKDFLSDIGATNTNELLIYSPGMDAGGPGGNFSGATSDIIASPVSANPYRENPQSVSRARGLGAPTATRNFFNTVINIDSYNTERVTVLRGPNAALIGVSSPAGIVDTSLAEASLRRNQNSVSFRVDNNGGTRTIADFSRVLLRDKLAARLIGLDSREEYNQRPAYQKKERLYGTVTYQPFRSTLIRGNFETGRMKANQPINILLQNSIPDTWYAAGRPGFDWAFYDDPSRNPQAASQASNNFIPYYMAVTGGNLMASYYSPMARQPTAIFQNNIPNTTGTAANAVTTALVHPRLNRDGATDNGRLVSTLNLQELPPAAHWVGANVLPGQLPGFAPPGLRLQGFTDFSAFDWKNRMIDESGVFTMDFHTANISVAQTAWQNRIGVEVAYDTQRHYNRAKALFVNGNGAGQTQIRVDTSATLPDGTPNPNLGRPFLQANNFRIQKRFHDDETMRATAYFKYDFKDLKSPWAKWLGRHTLGGVAERYRTDEIVLVTRVRFDGPDVRNTVANINASNTILNVYMGPTLIGNNNAIRLEAIKIPSIQTGPYGQISTFVRAAGNSDPGTFRDSPVSIVEVVQPATATREVIKSQAFTLQSNWLENHVATVVGWRKDVDYNNGSISVGFPTNPTSTGPFDPGVSEFSFDDFNFPRTPPEVDRKESKSYSVVLHWPKKIIPLPRGAEVSVFYNNSENFTPSGHRTDQYGMGIHSPKGKTKEHGFTLSFFDNKLSLRGSRFETATQYLQFQGTAASGGPRNLVTAVANWSREGNVNPHLVASRNADIAKVVSFLPAGLLELYQFRVSGAAPNLEVTHLSSPATGGSDTADLSAEGFELELVYNPTSNWRILANVAKQETVRSNVLPFMKQYAADVAPLVAELGDRPFGNYPIGYQPGQMLPANVQTLAQFIDTNLTTPLAADLASEGLPSAEQRKWRVNFVTNYRFGRGTPFGERLKGWSVGGGVRWQSKFAIGYPSSRLPNSVPVYDVLHPWYAPADLNLDASIGYTRKIWRDRIDWKVQVNGTNLYQKRDLIPVSAQPWGQVAIMRLAPERRFFLTNTFSF